MPFVTKPWLVTGDDRNDPKSFMVRPGFPIKDQFKKTENLYFGLLRRIITHNAVNTVTLIHR